MSRVILGGQKGIVNIGIIPISFSQMNNDQMADLVQYSYPSIPSRLLSSSNGKIYSAFIDSVYSNTISDIISIRNGVSL
jgi:hypothetical protein